tara:strand:+ start:1552 stop:1755 length:204 start_codon:yes stop_codon:yes gene_type:complete
MQLLKKIKELKKSIQETDELVEQLISSLRAEEIRSEKKENKILQLKDEINLNIKKIDKIIDNYNANN